VNYAAKTLQGGTHEIRLMHVIRAQEQNVVTEAKDRINALFDEARKEFETFGFSAQQIHTNIVTNAQSRAESIVCNAEENGFSTIVIGRRGLSKTQEFFIGRVSNKVIYMTKGMAVWVVP
jgi:nucleotide-binding universal stress UspA family protein